jgi:hypothetical protein
MQTCPTPPPTEPNHRRGHLTTITAILPAYNQEISIGSVVLYTRKYADRVLVIDDGSRYMGGNGRNTPAYRRVGQTVPDKATYLNSGLEVTDPQSGFRAFAADTVRAFRFRQGGFGIESETLADAAKAGFRVKEVEIGVRYDVDCSTESPVSHEDGCWLSCC